MRFALQAWDGFGNISNPTLESFDVSIVGVNSPISLQAIGRALGDGRYSFAYTANVAGAYKVHVKLVGGVVVGGAFTPTLVLTPNHNPNPNPNPKGGGGRDTEEPRQIRGSPFDVVVSPGTSHNPPAHTESRCIQ